MRPDERSSTVYRLLAQLRKAEPAYLRKVTSFLFELWALQEASNLVSVHLLRTDGIQVVHDGKRVFYMHIDRRSWALLLLRSSDLLAKQSEALSRLRHPTPGSHDFQYRLSEAGEFETLLRFLRKLRKARYPALDAKRSRLIPAAVQEIAWERFERHGGKCENPTCAHQEAGAQQLVWHIDHTLPFKRGGSSIDPNNLRVLCAKCNLTKSE